MTHVRSMNSNDMNADTLHHYEKDIMLENIEEKLSFEMDSQQQFSIDQVSIKDTFANDAIQMDDTQEDGNHPKNCATDTFSKENTNENVEGRNVTLLNKYITAKNIPLETLEENVAYFIEKRVDFIYDIFRLEASFHEKEDEEMILNDPVPINNYKVQDRDSKLEIMEKYFLQMREIVWRYILQKENELEKDLLNGRGEEEQSLLFVFRKITEILFRRKTKHWDKLFFKRKWLIFNLKYCSPAILEQVFVHFLKSGYTCDFKSPTIISFFVSQLENHMEWQELLTSSIFINHWLELKTLLDIIEILKHASSFVFIEIASIKVSEYWKQSSFSKHASKEKQEYVTYALLLLLNNWNKEGFEQSAVLNHCLLGIQNRLGSVIPYTQRGACLVAEKLSILLETKKVLLDDIDHLEEFEKMVYDIQNQPEHLLTVPSYAQEMEEEELSKPFNPEDEFNPDEESEEISLDEDSDSLVTLSDDDEGLDLLPVQPPKYLRELKSLYLTKQNDSNIAERIEIGLKYGERLIRKKPDDIDFLSRSIIALLLHLPDYNIENFKKNRHLQMVALVVVSPKNSIRYLCSEFYGNHLSIAQRIDILNVFSDSALELSNRSNNVLKNSDESSKHSPSIQEISAKYPTSTRIWGTLNRKDTEVKRNNFLLYSNDMFLQLIRDYDNPENSFHLLGEDFVLLAKLLYTLGTIIYCCGQTQEGATLSIIGLKFVKIFMHHFSDPHSNRTDIKIRLTAKEIESKSKENIFVRQNVLQLLLQCISCLPAYLLSGDWMDEIEFFIDWLFLVSREDADETCRHLASHILVTLKKKLNI